MRSLKHATPTGNGRTRNGLPLGGETRHAFQLAIGGTAALAAGLGIGRFVYTPILPAMVEALGLTKTQAGLIASANFVGYLLGALAAAAPLLPGSRLNWLRGNLVVVTASMLAMAWTDTMAGFLVLRFVAGFASAFVLVIASSLVTGGLARLRAISLSPVHFAGVGTGIAVSALLTDWLQASGIGWRGQWLAAGLVAAASIAPVMAFVRDHEMAAGGPAGERRLKGTIGFTFAYGLCGLGYSVTGTFIVAMVRGMPDHGALEFLSWMCVGLAAVPSVWLWNIAGHTAGVRRAMAVASLLQALGTSAGVLWPTKAGILISAIFLGATFMGITALGFAATQRLAPEPRRRINAVISAAFGVGQIVGPLLAGAIADRTGSFLAPTLVAAAASVLASCILLAQGNVDRP